MFFFHVLSFEEGLYFFFQDTIYMYIRIFSRSQQFSATFCSLVSETESDRYSIAGCIIYGTTDLYPFYSLLLYGPQAQLADTLSDNAPVLIFRQ